jgi:hypothetical protein
MASTKQHPALGRMTKGLGGKKSGEGRGGPGTGKVPGSVDNTRGMNATAPAGGKAHKSMGGGERKGFYPNAPKDFPSLDGKLNKVADKW